jgi:hypothetical protein
MAPKKGKKNASRKKKAVKPVSRASKKTAPKISAKITGLETAKTDSGSKKTAKLGIPCICIETEEGFFCMKRLPTGRLKECDGPFGTLEQCERHNCRK